MWSVSVQKNLNIKYASAVVLVFNGTNLKLRIMRSKTAMLLKKSLRLFKSQNKNWNGNKNWEQNTYSARARAKTYIEDKPCIFPENKYKNCVTQQLNFQLVSFSRLQYWMTILPNTWIIYRIAYPNANRIHLNCIYMIFIWYQFYVSKCIYRKY